MTRARAIIMAVAVVIVAGCDSASRTQQSFHAAARWCDEDSFVFDQKREGTTITMIITCEEDR